MAKLIRDKIPEVMKAQGIIPKVHTASDEEYEKKLKEKLVEEAHEFVKSGEPEELADILEVIDALCAYKNMDRKGLERIQQEKAKSKGKFNNKIILEQ